MIAAGGPADVVAKQFVNVWLELANHRNIAVSDLGIDPARMAELASMTSDGTVNRTAAKHIAELMRSRPQPPRELAEELGLIQVRDADTTARWVDEAFAANEEALRDAVEDPKKAKAAAGFLRGQVMRISGGKADPQLVAKLIEDRLSMMSP